MRLFNVTLEAITTDDIDGWKSGNVKEVNVPSSDFVFIDSVDVEKVAVTLIDRDGSVVADLADVTTTSKLKSTENFDKVRLKNNSASTAHVKFYVGTGDYNNNETSVKFPEVVKTNNAVQTNFRTGTLTLTQGEQMKNLLDQLPNNSIVNDFLVIVPEYSANDVVMSSSSGGDRLVTLKKGVAFSATSSFNVYFGTSGTASGDTSHLEYAIGYV